MEIVLVLALLVVAVVLFVSERWPVDLVALALLSALLLFGLVTVEEGLSGFSSTATITIACMFIISAGLQKTRAIAVIGRILIRFGRSQPSLLLTVIIVSAAVSAFINNTAAVAVLIPIVLAVAARRKIPSSKLLIPLSYASQFGGVCTLIGTSTNLLVSAVARDLGYEPFSMFEFSALGLIMVVTGSLYLLLVGYWILPSRTGDQLTERYKLSDYISELRVLSESPLVGKTVLESDFGHHFDATVLRLLRDNDDVWPFVRERIEPGDILLVRAKIGDIVDIKESQKLETHAEFKHLDQAFQSHDLRLIEVVVAPDSHAIGATLPELDFRNRYRALVVAIQHRGQSLRRKLNQIRLKFGDTLLLQLPKNEIKYIRSSGDFIVLDELDETLAHAQKGPLAMAILAGVVIAAAIDLVPVVVAALVGAILVVLSRCLTMEEAYEAIDWRVILLLAGLLPLGIALERTGAAGLLAQQTLRVIGDHGPLVALAAIYACTAVLTEFMSNNAAALMMAPIAASAATTLGVNPRAFLIAVCFAASTSFATPLGYQTNTMVYSPGGYRFSDFARVGIPLNIIFWIIATIFIPIIWPFQ